MTQAGLIERLESSQPILMDGAINTELAALGLVFNEHEWLRVNLDNPDAVAQVHASYARAGAEIHIANSFATAKHVTEHYGFAESFESLNRAAVILCREAIDAAASHTQWIAGSISTYAPDHDRSKLPSMETMQDNCREQALILADAGCDMIALEMIASSATGAAMVAGAAAAGLPISVGLICGRTEHGEICLTHRTLEPEPLADALPKILDSVPVDTNLIVTVMHTDVDDTPAALTEIREVWSGKFAAYPHTGQPDGVGGWDYRGARTETEFAQSCLTAADEGACFVGGCCGIGPAYIGKLAGQLFAQREKAQ